MDQSSPTQTQINERLGVNKLLTDGDTIKETEIPPYFPVREFILVEPVDDEEKTDKGIWLPGETRSRPSTSRIIRYGSGVPLVLPSIAIDENVLHSKYAGNEIKYKNNRFLIITAKDVLCFERFAKR